MKTHGKRTLKTEKLVEKDFSEIKNILESFDMIYKKTLSNQGFLINLFKD